MMSVLEELHVLPALRTTPPIGLAELLERAELQTRIDRKYVIPLADVQELVTELSRGARVLEISGSRSFAYQSMYFDTPELMCYYLAAHRQRRRFKIRSRGYLDTGEYWLEVKIRGPRGTTIKERLPYGQEHSHHLTPEARAFVAYCLDSHGVRGHERLDLQPTMSTHYRRSTLLLPDSDSRVTIDLELAFATPDGHRKEVPDAVVLETKSVAAASAADVLLWRHGHRPARISKFATGLAALRPELPSNAWHRILRRHFDEPVGSCKETS